MRLCKNCNSNKY